MKAFENKREDILKNFNFPTMVEKVSHFLITSSNMCTDVPSVHRNSAEYVGRQSSQARNIHELHVVCDFFKTAILRDYLLTPFRELANKNPTN